MGKTEAICECGDAQSSHVLGKGECLICKWNPCIPTPEGHCKEFRFAWYYEDKARQQGEEKK